MLASLVLFGCAPQMSPSTTGVVTITDAEVRAEVERLHDVFTAWFRGDDSATLDPVRDALAPSFVIVSPRGTVADRNATLTGLASARGTWGTTDMIEIENLVVRQRTATTVLATYEEWQSRAGSRKGRVSTVMFAVDRDRPGELRWLHVHETWLPDVAP